MYKPFEFYASERKLQSKIQLDLIRQEWSKLESRDQLRYIKQAESEYDKFFEDDDPRYYSFHHIGYPQYYRDI